MADETFDRHTRTHMCSVEGARAPLRRADRSTRVEAFLLSTGVIFVAELGDKSQLMALTFATRFRARTVLLAITLATAIVHLVSVFLGAAIGSAIPTDAISVIAGLAFLAFAAWTLRGDELTEEERTKAQRVGGSALLAVGTAFFIAELGDKTMLATVTLATDNGLFGTWVGSTLGMVLADALAIAAGLWVGKNLPEKAVKYGAAAAFTFFGALLIWQGLSG
jgi:putative Ca2+/H+ antiporter (TMEM165/GDT1 family)